MQIIVFLNFFLINCIVYSKKKKLIYIMKLYPFTNTTIQNFCNFRYATIIINIQNIIRFIYNI